MICDDGQMSEKAASATVEESALSAPREARVHAGLKPPWPCSCAGRTLPLADFGPWSRNRRHLLRCDLKHGASAHMDEAQLPRGQQRVDGIFDFRARDEVPEEYFQVGLFDGD